MRRAETRIREALIEAMGTAIRRSVLVAPVATSSTAGTARPFNRYDEPSIHNFWYSVYIFCAKPY
jgi:hypothetical protein